MEFWIGVPVRSKRFLQFIPRRILHRELAELLIACASSRIIYCHLTLLKYCSSVTTFGDFLQLSRHVSQNFVGGFDIF